jgi:hypothetical protein
MRDEGFMLLDQGPTILSQRAGQLLEALHISDQGLQIVGR